MRRYDFNPLISRGYMGDKRGPTTNAFAGPLNLIRTQMNELADDMNAIRADLHAIRELSNAIAAKTARRTSMR